MRFSIVTPSFNQGEFIGSAIESVKAQAMTVDVEHIVLDNCSTDGTGASLSQYRDDPGRVSLLVIIEGDKGQTDAINRGFRMSTGDIVAWLNTDERYHVGALHDVQRFFEANPDVDVVFGDCDFEDAHGQLVKRKREFGFSFSMLLFYGCYMPSCSTFVRRRVVDAGIYLDPEFKVTMDFDWYVRIAAAGFRVAHLPRSLASFTWHGSNISSRLVERRKIERRMVQDAHSRIKGSYRLRTIQYEALRRTWEIARVICRRVMR